mgnify:CR=1 FL=1
MADELLPKLPLVALIVAAQHIELDAEPESGTAGLLAEREDALAAAQKRQGQADKEVQELNTLVEETLKNLMATRQQGDEAGTAKSYQELAQARQQLDKATRQSAKAEAKHELEKLQLEKLREEYHLTDPTEIDQPEEKLSAENEPNHENQQNSDSAKT